jgi:hypothetical protein
MQEAPTYDRDIVRLFFKTFYTGEPGDHDAIKEAVKSFKIVAWRYQRREGWGDVWRLTEINPMDLGFFEMPDDWTVQPLFALAAG